MTKETFKKVTSVKDKPSGRIAMPVELKQKRNVRKYFASIVIMELLSCHEGKRGQVAAKAKRFGQS